MSLIFTLRTPEHETTTTKKDRDPDRDWDWDWDWDCEETGTTTTAAPTTTTTEQPPATTSTTEQPPASTTSTTEQPSASTTSTTEQPPATTTSTTEQPPATTTTAAPTTTTEQPTSTTVGAPPNDRGFELTTAAPAPTALVDAPAPIVTWETTPLPQVDAVVLAPPVSYGTPGTLPHTGSETLATVGVGGALVAVALVVCWIARRLSTTSVDAATHSG